MTTVQDVLEFLQTLAPQYMKMDWDNVGLLCGRPDREVRRILVALDPFEAVCREAADWQAELLVTHHPLIFQPLPSVTDGTSAGRCILFLAARGIAAVNAHTNLDCAPGGVNDCLAHVLGLEQVEVLHPSGTDGRGRPWGLLRAGRTEPVSLRGVFKPGQEPAGLPGRAVCLRRPGSLPGGGGRRSLRRLRAGGPCRRMRHLCHSGRQI